MKTPTASPPLPNLGLREAGYPSVPVTRPKAPTSIPLGRLTEYKNKKGDISSVLAWDDLTHMKLEAGKVKEARAKEVGYIRDKRVYDNIPRTQAVRDKWNVVQVRWIDINKRRKVRRKRETV